MSMISERVKELRQKADIFSKVFDEDGVVRIMREAADTIEALSAKLAAANMERSERHYGGGWIPCSEKLPEKNGVYLATFDGEIIGGDEPFVGTAEFEYGEWADDEEDYKYVLAWMPLSEPYKSDGEVGE